MARTLGGADRKVRASDLRDRVTFLRYENTRDGIGGHTSVLTSYKEVFAAIRPTTVEEEFEAKQIGFEASHEIIIRRDMNIKNGWFASWTDPQLGNRRMTVMGIRDLDAERRFTVVYVKEDIKGTKR